MELEFRGPAASHVEELVELCRLVASEGGRCRVVGGSVRDALWEKPSREFDLEVYGLEAKALRDLLARRYRLDLVGESFGVIKLRDHPFDVALPRRESKSGLGHRGFEVLSDPMLTPREAASRRDFTINAIAYDPLADELSDPFAGLRDLESRTLRHVSERFVEDPLRVLRGMQFIARFGLQAAPETVALCRQIGMEDLASERVFEEFRKLLLQGVRIGDGLRFLLDCDWLVHFPEIAALVGCAQDPQWHPEGDVFVHTGLVLDAFARRRIGDEWEDLVVGVACLCHDLGKPAASFLEEGRIRSPNHEALGEQPTRDLIARWTNHRQLANEVVPLVREHLKPQQLFAAGASDSAVRRLAARVDRIDRLVRVVEADQRGRPPLLPDDRATQWLVAAAERLEVEDQAPEPIVLGRHLVARGYQPGPLFRTVLDAAYEEQMEGRLTEANCEAWLDENLAVLWERAQA